MAVPAATVTEPGRMVMIMGTSTCHMVLGTEEHIVPGMCGYVEDGIIPGFFGYEAGQSCVGDHFAWFVENCVPAAYERGSEERGMDIHQLLEEKAAKLKPGESGLLALDWWNGNRSVLVDVDLTGLLLGVTLATKPEEIYRALIEATAYGKRIIIETFQKNGVPIHELVACGGLPEKNKLLMQIYADVIGLPIKVSASKQTPALGSAMFGAVAAGKAPGGYDSIYDAARVMAHLKDEVYTANPENQEVYEKLYAEYVLLHDYFGRGENDVMKRLKKIKAEVRQVTVAPIMEKMLENLKKELVQSAPGTAEKPSGGVDGRQCQRARSAKPVWWSIKASGIRYEEMSPEHMVVVDMDGKVVEGDFKPSSDVYSHLYIYKHRPDVCGVVHTHSRYATAFAAVGKPIPCVLTAMADEFGGPIPCGGFALIGDEAIGKAGGG